MTRKEAIERIKIILEECIENEDAVSYVTSYDADALDMAIKALKQEPCEDCISRQAAIDVADAVWSVTGDKNVAKVWDQIKDLPSAQPEIIRCTECKHYREYDSEYVENAVVVQCMADRYPISETIPDGWFCAGAERKDDE